MDLSGSSRIAHTGSSPVPPDALLGRIDRPVTVSDAAEARTATLIRNGVLRRRGSRVRPAQSRRMRMRTRRQQQLISAIPAFGPEWAERTAGWTAVDEAAEDQPRTIDLSDRPMVIRSVPAQPVSAVTFPMHTVTIALTAKREARTAPETRLAEPTLAAVLAAVASLAAWTTMAPSSIWLPLAVLPATGLLALLMPGQDAARPVRAALMLAAAAVLPAMSSAMTPVTLLIALAAAAVYPLLVEPVAARALIGGAMTALIAPLVMEAFRAGLPAFPGSLLHPASGAQTAVLIALTAGIVITGLIGTGALATRRLLTSSARATALQVRHQSQPGTAPGAENKAENEAEPQTQTQAQVQAQPQAQVQLQVQPSVESELEEAIRAGLIEVSFQPVLALGTDDEKDEDDRIVGAEALACWTRADGTTVPAKRLIRMAGELGLGNQLGLHIIERALDALLDWRNEGVGVDQIWVNVAPGHLGDPDLAQHISALLAVRGLNASCLVLEVSATGSITEPALTSMGTLRSIGIAIALDDFGRSGTSLTTLRALPISAVKIDHRLGSELGKQDAVPRSIIQLCHSLGLRVVVEGIETMLHLRGARAIQADAVQGHAIARPMSAEDVTNLLSLRLPREFRLP